MMAAQLVAILLMMVLVVRGLAMRRLSAGRTAKLALIWLAIFAAAVATVAAIGLAR